MLIARCEIPGGTSIEGASINGDWVEMNSRWLADLSAWVTAWNLVCRGSEAAMRTEARKHREQSNQVKDRP